MRQHKMFIEFFRYVMNGMCAIYVMHSHIIDTLRPGQYDNHYADGII